MPFDGGERCCCCGCGSVLCLKEGKCPQSSCPHKGPFCRVIPANTAHAGSRIFPRQHIANTGKFGTGRLTSASLEAQGSRRFMKSLICTSENTSTPFPEADRFRENPAAPRVCLSVPESRLSRQGRDEKSPPLQWDHHPAQAKRLLGAAES